MPRYIHPNGMAAGSIQSTLSDLVQWIQLHVNGGIKDGKPFISPYNLKQMHKPHMLIPATAMQENMFGNDLFAYGLGWFVEPYRGHALIHHGGNLDGFSVMGAFVPQENISAIILTNINGKSLRNALLYESVDRALGLSSKDWSQTFLKRNSETVTSEVKGLETARIDRKKDRPPSFELATYAGSYNAPGYSDVEVKWQGDGLQVLYSGEWFPLEHYHHEVFELNIERFDSKTKVAFILDVHGNLTHLNVPIEPAVGMMAFTRKPDVLGDEIAAQLTADYEHPVEFQVVSISINDEKLVFALTGQKPTRLHYVTSGINKTGEKTLDFKLDGNAESFITFINSGLGFDQLVIKHPGASFNCARMTNTVAV